MQTNNRFNIVQLHNDAKEWVVIDGQRLSTTERAPDSKIMMAGLTQDEAIKFSNTWQKMYNEGTDYRDLTNDQDRDLHKHLQEHLNCVAVFKFEKGQHVRDAKCNVDGQIRKNGVITAMRHGIGDAEPCYLIRFRGINFNCTESEIDA